MINIPNIITLTGLIVVCYSMYMYYMTSDIYYIVLGCIGFSCDYFDGLVARTYNMTSNLGNILDKMVDKINQITLLTILMLKFNISPIYIYLYIQREVIMYLMRKFNMKSINSSFYGKLKTFLFPITIILFHFNASIKYTYLNMLTIFNYITLLL